MLIRRVNLTDAKELWRIRNSASVRKNSNHTEKIEWLNHLTWFKKKYFESKGNFCFVLEKNKQPAGYCRFDREGNHYVISIALRPNFQGKGLGSAFLAQALKKMETSREILAEVKLDNQSSIKLFLKNGFEIYRQDKKVFYFRYDKNQSSLKKEIINLYYLLEHQPPVKSQAIVWLHGDRHDRGPKVLELFKNHWAPKIVIAGNNVLTGAGKRPGENNILIKAMAGWLSRHRVSPEKVIIDKNSFNTKDQAVNIIKFAKLNKWKNIILVASSYHQPRAFLTFLKQAQKLGWQGRIINQSALIAWQRVPSGRTKYAWQCFNEEIEKIKKYKKDLAAAKAGIKILKSSK